MTTGEWYSDAFTKLLEAVETAVRDLKYEAEELACDPSSVIAIAADLEGVSDKLQFEESTMELDE